MELTARSIRSHQAAAPSTAQVRTGWGLTALAGLFLAFDATGKLMGVAQVLEGTQRLGFGRDAVLPLGIIEAVCIVAYLVPRSSILGALLLTGWFGGAVAAHLRIGDPLLSHTLFPIYAAVVVWTALFLRSSALRVAIRGSDRA